MTEHVCSTAPAAIQSGVVFFIIGYIIAANFNKDIVAFVKSLFR